MNEKISWTDEFYKQKTGTIEFIKSFMENQTVELLDKDFNLVEQFDDANISLEEVYYARIFRLNGCSPFEIYLQPDNINIEQFIPSIDENHSIIYSLIVSFCTSHNGTKYYLSCNHD
jgi:hypothetical protein